LDFAFNPTHKFLHRVPFDLIRINGQPIEREQFYTITVRDYIYEGFDGYDELPKCENIDKCNDISTMIIVTLKFFELVKTLDESSFTQGINELEPGSFGFDQGCKDIFNYMRKVVVFKNGRAEIIIDTPERIHKIA
jgi:hypothetical protein